MKSCFTLLSLSSHVFQLQIAQHRVLRMHYHFDSSPKMTTVQTIGTVSINAVLPSTPANWLYLESDFDGLRSDQVQDLQYTYTSHLNHRSQRYKVSTMLRTSLVRWETKRKNYWEDELHLRYEYATKRNRHSLAIPRDWSLSQIVMVLVQTYGISRSHLNHRCQRYKVYRSCSKSQEVLDQAWRDDSVPE